MESLFFWTSKLAWLMIAPDNLVVILLVVAWILLRRGAYRPAAWLLGTVTTALIVVALLPVGEWLLYPLESRFAANPKLPDRIDGVIVLSGTEDAVRSSLWQQVELHDSAEREMAFLELARRYPKARLVFTGGSGSMLYQDNKAADVARKLFDNLGLDLSRVTFERNSRNTYENAVMSRELVRPDPAQTWVLITTAWHMPRSVGIFRNIGWPVIPYPVDHWTRPGKLLRVDMNLSGNLRSLVTGVREWVGLLAYYLSGKTAVLFPGRGDPPA